MARNVNNSTSGKTAKTSKTFPICDFSVTNVKWWDNDTHATFNLTVPDFGMTVYGVSLRYKNESAFLSFPKRTDKEGRHWNHVFFTLDPEMTNSIIDTVENT